MGKLLIFFVVFIVAAIIATYIKMQKDEKYRKDITEKYKNARREKIMKKTILITAVTVMLTAGSIIGCGASKSTDQTGTITADMETDQLTADTETDLITLAFSKSMGNVDYEKIKAAYEKKSSTYNNGNTESGNTESSREQAVVNEPTVVNEEKQENTVKTDASDFVFPYSDSEPVDLSAVESLSDESLRIAINEIFARHGRKFKSEELQTYFESKSWYKPRYEADEFDQKQKSLLNEVEKENIKILAAERESRKR